MCTGPPARFDGEDVVEHVGPDEATDVVLHHHPLVVPAGEALGVGEQVAGGPGLSAEVVDGRVVEADEREVKLGEDDVDVAVGIDEIAGPFGSNEAEFIGAFSNVGPQVDLTAPGVGIISTYPGGYTEISGTAMAAAAVSGVAARLLAASPEALLAPRDAARSEAILALVLASARDRGFPDPLEGHGLPQDGPPQALLRQENDRPES